MKYCAHCGKELFDEAAICMGCGCSPDTPPSASAKKKYCTKCGAELFTEAVVCTHCGCAVKVQKDVDNSKELISTLSKRLLINGIIWVCIGALQLVIGLIYLNGIGETWGLDFLLLVGVMNLISGGIDLYHSKSIRTKPVKIIKRYSPLFNPIVTLIYNVLFGGIVGVAGSLYHIFGVRNYVVDNQEAFEVLEAMYS